MLFTLGASWSRWLCCTLAIALLGAVVLDRAALASGLSLPDVPDRLAVRKALPSAKNGIVELRFRDFFRMPVGPGGLEPSDALRAADGQRVRLVGFMVRQAPNPADGFLLTSVPVATSDEDEGLADDLPAAIVHVAFASTAGTNLPYLPGLLKITGTLQLQPHVDTATQRISAIQLVPDRSTHRALAQAVAKAHARRRSP
jgi:hypothetical protein